MTSTTLALKCDFSSEDYNAICEYLGRIPVMWDTIERNNPHEVKERLGAFQAIANYPSDFFYANDVGIGHFICCSGVGILTEYESTSSKCLRKTGHERTEIVPIGDGYWKEVKVKEWERIISSESLLQELLLMKFYYHEACASF